MGSARLADGQDGQNNTVAASRWACAVESDHDPDGYGDSRCNLYFSMDEEHTISHIIVCEYIVCENYMLSVGARVAPLLYMWHAFGNRLLQSLREFNLSSAVWCYVKKEGLQTKVNSHGRQLIRVCTSGIGILKRKIY